ncbi:hypothetical protein [Streptomyces broussonetiae]|uniref:DUF3558 domain-containing protein n=1 Tax=Streptomyces broussonetiae TaxID=2686304 RepID=A0A6I6NB23_9ACTN|nr:hypothetical protein [Streptomyces broussonetiae]QHA07190.1 hypothetical protein GQF42_31275 [Streptomyces broussonetiae]
MSHIRLGSPLVHISGFIAVSLALASCSSGTSEDKRDYSVPSSLCGTAMSTSALKPLLPAGKKISSRQSGSTGYVRCQVSVDGQVVLSSIIERWKPKTTLTDVAFGTYGLTSDNVKKKKENYIVADTTAVGHVTCRAKRKDGAEVFTVIRKEHGSVDVAAMEEAITKFTDAVSTSKQCTESNA